MLSATFARYREIISHRDDCLFLQFLPQGYEATTLSAVPAALRDTLLVAKVNLGMYITLVDDFADNPEHFRPRLLPILHRVPFHWEEVRHAALPASERAILSLANDLCDGFFSPLRDLPHAEKLLPVFRFDLEQFINANWFASLVTGLPELANETEIRQYGSFNMGMVASGMMDVMALPGLRLTELGDIRRVLYLGQRIGRICNVLVTFDRENREGDLTNELMVSDRDLVEERERHFRELRRRENAITSFSVAAYARGLRRVQALHERLRGRL